MAAKILIVDDDPHILMPLEFLMIKNGYEVLIARNGMEAIGIIQKHIPDLVLLDIMMPDVNGYEICKLIRNTPGYERCKVVFVSAKTSEEDKKKGYELGASLYISKPFSTRDLVKKVAELIHEKA